MESYAKAMLELSKQCITEYVTSSRMVTAKPCHVFSIVVDPTDAAAATKVYLRNGETSVSDILLGLGAQYSHVTHVGHTPIYFNKGLYVDLAIGGDNEDGVTVQYLIDPDV